MKDKPFEVSLTPEDQKYLEAQINNGTEKTRVNRARILLLKSSGETIEAIADKLSMSEKVVRQCLSKYLNDGIEEALSCVFTACLSSDGITDEEKAWISDLAYVKPVDLGLCADKWSNALLTGHIRKFATFANRPNLSAIDKDTVKAVLDEKSIKLSRIAYHGENNKTETDGMVHSLMVLFRRLAVQPGEDGNILIFDDQKPDDVAAAKTDAADGDKIISGENRCKDLSETIELIAGVNLQTGEILVSIDDTHSNAGYVEFLKTVDDRYSRNDKIRLVPENFNNHYTDRVREYLITVPGRFEFVISPQNGAWLTLVDAFFNRTMSQCLANLRVRSKDEAASRLKECFDELNNVQALSKWKINPNDINVSDEIVKVEFTVPTECTEDNVFFYKGNPATAETSGAKINMRLAQIQDALMFENPSVPEKSHIYCVYYDSDADEVRAIRTTHLYNPEKKNFDKISKGMIIKTYFAKFHAVSGVNRYFATSYVSGSPLKLDDPDIHYLKNAEIPEDQAQHIISCLKNPKNR